MVDPLTNRFHHEVLTYPASLLPRYLFTIVFASRTEEIFHPDHTRNKLCRDVTKYTFRLKS